MTLHVSTLQSIDEYRAVLREDGSLSEDDIEQIAGAISRPIGIKQLLMVLEMARDESNAISPARFMQCLTTCGY